MHARCTTVTHFISVRRCSNLLVRAQRLCFSDPCCHCGKKKRFVCFVTKDDNKNKQIGWRSFYHLNKETTVTQKNKLWLFTILSWNWPTMDHTSRDGSLNTSSLGRGKTGLIRREAPGVSDARQKQGMDSNTELPLRFEVRVQEHCQTAIPKTHTECHELGHMRSSALGADFLV